MTNAPEPAVLRSALLELENACDAVAGLRSHEAYLAMIATPGMSDALLRLDAARQNAREITSNG